MDILSQWLVIEKLKTGDMAPIKFAILTVSDTCAKNEKTDESGAALKQLINDIYNTKDNRQGKVVCFETVSDEVSLITKILTDWSDKKIANVILTTGGTGFSNRDVTPEATKSVIHKEAPGLSVAMLMSSLKITPMAMLSRAVCGIRNQTLIINLPGSPKAAKECFSAIAETIPHAIDLLLDNKEEIKDTHNIVQHDISTCSHNKFYINTNAATRLRESLFPMVSVEEAVDEIVRSAREENKTEVEVIDANNAYGRMLYDEVYSNCHLPPFRASIKDGYAVLASDGKGKRKVLCGVKAGASDIPVVLVPGTCVRVNTGAPIPDEATAVVQVEDTKLVSKTSDGIEEDEIEIMIEPKEGQDIRSIGSDIEKGSLVLETGTYIGVAEMGLLAACGNYKISVQKRPSIGILSTGDELQETGMPLEPGHVYDSNKITLISLLKENNYDALDFGIAVDDEIIMVDRIKTAIEKVDILVTTGSVSMGDRDLLKPILEKHFEATIHFGRVNMKPGKPTTFATCLYKNKKKYFLCLPGNPVSAFVTAHLFVLPLLRYLQFDISESIVVVAKMSSYYALDERPEYVRATLKWEIFDHYPIAYITGNQISSKLLNCKRANALLKLPKRTKSQLALQEGDFVPAILISKMTYK
ncbi:gephyrin [Linepithema humile]|uniref:gephyrin n=1 Tax=Linepithema humile TaxID=83485 RepID=UPI0006237C45|nr:PREDICTED: gephyrin [Linepithema humile]